MANGERSISVSAQAHAIWSDLQGGRNFLPNFVDDKDGQGQLRCSVEIGSHVINAHARL